MQAWIQRGFEDFARGRFADGGSNLYVNARGVIETIHRTDVNNDGYVDIVLPNSHGYIERGPTWIYKVGKGAGKNWPRQQLPNDSGWMSRVVDVDGDGFLDLIVVNGENGVTSELPSYIYWGGPNGLTGDRTELPTAGAYDVAVVDINRDGRLGLIFPSAWTDHHNPGRPRLLPVYLQTKPRQFADASPRYGLNGVAAMSVASADLNGDGRPELVVANYRCEFEYDTDSFVYWGTADGFDASAPLRLPTHCALRVLLADLNDDGRQEIIFCGGDQVMVYWNKQGAFSPDNRTIIAAKGFSTMFCRGAVNATVADVDGDGKNELILATERGIEIRSSRDLQTARTVLPVEYATWVQAADLDGDGRLELIASKYDDRITYETESAIFWNGPQGFSADRVSRLPTAGAMGCTAGDLDGDGQAEVVFNNTMLGPSQFDQQFPLYLYLGNERCQYSADRRLELPTGGSTNTYVVADFDLDGYPDLAFPSPEGVRIFHGGPTGPSQDRFTVLPGRGAPFGYVLAADLNRDGWLDLLAVPWTYDAKPTTMANSSVIYWGSPAGFSAERTTVVPTYCQGNGHLADVNNDGWLEFVYGDTRGYLGVYLGGPNGFSPEKMWKIPLEGTDLGTVVSINSADLNRDGWLDLIVVLMGHYRRTQSGFFLLYGGPDGFRPERTHFQPTAASSVRICVADLDRDGNLDLLVPAYSTQFSRELPAHIFWGTGKGFDFSNPLVIPCDSSCAFMAVALTRNGYPDVLAVCHRNDLGHQVDSLLFWNGPDGLSLERATRLPGLGPHLASSRDFGNAYTREPTEHYVSSAFELADHRPIAIHWDAHVPETTQLEFQLRWASRQEQLEQARWQGPGGEGTYYERSGQAVQGVPREARWLQYRASFVSLSGCRSPQLREVRVDLKPKERKVNSHDEDSDESVGFQRASR